MIGFFDREIAALGGGPFELPYLEILSTLKSNGGKEADDACRAYAATLIWPPLSDRVRLEVLIRMSCARWWCTDVGDQEEDETMKEFLESLLLEFWHDVGRTEWLYHHFVNPKPDLQ